MSILTGKNGNKSIVDLWAGIPGKGNRRIKAVYVGTAEKVNKLVYSFQTHIHNYSNTPEENTATCTQSGTVKYYCSCGAYREEYKAALGHAWDGGTHLNEATCTSPELVKFTCSRCNATETQEVSPKLDHDYVIEQKVEDCESDGFIKYVCTRCNSGYSESLPAIGHKSAGDETFFTDEDTNTSYVQFTCVNCRQTITEPT